MRLSVESYNLFSDAMKIFGEKFDLMLRPYLSCRLSKMSTCTLFYFKANDNSIYEIK